MIYAINLFNLIDGAEQPYKRYALEAGRVLSRVGAHVVVAGHNPLRILEGDVLREWFIVVAFPSEEAFSSFLSLVDSGPMHGLRESITSDYLWTTYEPWNVSEWVQT